MQEFQLNSRQFVYKSQCTNAMKNSSKIFPTKKKKISLIKFDLILDCEMKSNILVYIDECQFS